MSLLSTQALRKSYGALQAVRGLALEVEKGEIFGFLGPNGAGKTTSISMIAGVVTPTAGTVTIAGHDIRSAPRAARRALGFVPQDVALYQELSARQNLVFFGRLYGLAGALLRARIDWALEVAGLTDRSDDRVAEFSGGMKRRLNLVTGLLHEPALLILDEPTVGVDPQSRHHIFETVRALRDEYGMTVLYTSHYMEEVEALCERVAIMDHGELVALDRVDHLARHGRGMVEIRVGGDIHTLSPALLDIIEKSEIDRHDTTWRIPAEAKLGPILVAIESCAGLQVRSIRSVENGLESVFLSLTGKHLRDDR